MSAAERTRVEQMTDKALWDAVEAKLSDALDSTHQPGRRHRTEAHLRYLVMLLREARERGGQGRLFH